MADQLKPCPFCGSSDIELEIGTPTCNNCSPLGPTNLKDKQTPVEAWNTRANDDLKQLQDDYRDRVMDIASRDIDIDTLKKGIVAVRELIDESAGVYGLHLNGEGAPWDELEKDGRCSGWLKDFNDAEDACDELDQSPLDKT